MPKNNPGKNTVQSEDEAVRSRRTFLKGAGVAGLGAAASVVVTDGAEAKSVESKDSSGYRETEHVNAYYAAAKF